jgi:hypothetical protein
VSYVIDESQFAVFRDVVSRARFAVFDLLSIWTSARINPKGLPSPLLGPPYTAIRKQLADGHDHRKLRALAESAQDMLADVKARIRELLEAGIAVKAIAPDGGDPRHWLVGLLNICDEITSPHIAFDVASYHTGQQSQTDIPYWTEIHDRLLEAEQHLDNMACVWASGASEQQIENPTASASHNAAAPPGFAVTSVANPVPTRFELTEFAKQLFADPIGDEIKLHQLRTAEADRRRAELELREAMFRAANPHVFEARSQPPLAAATDQEPPATRASEKGEGAGARRQQKKRGRPKDSDPAADRRIAEAWKTGQYLKYADLEREMNLAAGEARRAIDRHRKRERLANE